MMELPIEVVKHVLKKGLTPEDSAQLLEKYSDIRAKVLDRDRKIARIRKTAQEQIKKPEDEVFCNHDVTKSHRDPSGGSDSCGECLICGEYI